jgi:hypothetical protein
MRRLAPSLVALMLAFASFGQNCNLSKAIINAPSGLILRSEAAKGYITSMPMGDTLKFCADQSFGKAQYEGINGNWRQAYYNNKEGYVFDGYLMAILQDTLDLDSLRDRSVQIAATSDSILQDNSPANKVEKIKPNSSHPNLKGSFLKLAIESYNFCGEIQSLDPSLYWYGVFLKSDLEQTGMLRVNPVDLKLILSKDKVGKGLEFDILTDSEERSLFLLGSDNIINHQDLALFDQSEAIRLRGSKLFPGQELALDNKRIVSISATGQVLKAGDCPQLKDYKVLINYNKDGLSLEQDLAELIIGYGDCQIPRIYWYGDISGDGLSEVIYVSVYEEQTVFTLLESIANPKKELFTRKAVFTLKNCQ